MALPDVIVEVGFDASGPLDATFTWTDVTEYFRDFTTKRGKQHELDKVEAGTCKVLLDNSDRRFDPTYSSGPYAPNVVPMKPIRVRATAPLGTTYDVFRGFVESWPIDYSQRFSSTVEIECVDAFKVLSLFQTKNYTDAVLEDKPTVYWRLDDEAGTLKAHDYSGQDPRADARLYGPVFVRNDHFTYGQPLVAQFSGPTSDDYMSAGEPERIADITESVTVEFWADILDIGNDGLIVYVNDGCNVRFTGDGLITMRSTGTGAGTSDVSATNEEAVWVHWVFVRDFDAGEQRAYKNGVLVATAVLGQTVLDSGYTAAADKLFIGGHAAGTFNTMDGYLAHLAVYDFALSEDRITEHYARRVIDAVGSQQSINVMQDVMLPLVGWPSSLTNLDLFSTVYISWKYRPTEDGLTECQRVVDSEGGQLWVSSDGKISTLKRDALTDGDAVQATFGDIPSASEIMYTGIDVSYDDSDLITQVTATSIDDVVYLADDAASQTKYGVKTHDLGKLALHDKIDIEERLYSKLNQSKKAKLRVQSMGTTEGNSTSDVVWDTLLGLELFDRCVVKRRPFGWDRTYLTFDGVDDYVSIPDSAVLDIESHAYTTFEFWVKPTNFSADRYVLAKDPVGSTPAGAYAIGVNTAGKIFMADRVGAAVLSTNAIAAGEWTHVAVVYDSSANTVAFFTNGVANGSGLSLTGVSDNANTLLVGRHGSGGFLLGGLDELRIWRIALDADIINATMSRELEGTEDGLVAYYRFGGNANAVVGSNGTANGSPVYATESAAPIGISEEVIVEGIEHSVRASDQTWRTTWSFVPAPSITQQTEAWLLGDPVYGVLGYTTRVGG